MGQVKKEEGACGFFRKILGYAWKIRRRRMDRGADPDGFLRSCNPFLNLEKRTGILRGLD